MQRNMDNGKADEDFQRLVVDPLGWIQTAKTERAETPQAHRSGEWGFYGGSERDRTVDLAIFSRSLYQLSYRAMNSPKDPDKPDQTIPSDSGRT